MKICFVTTNFPRYLGDSEAPYVSDAVQAVSRHGHQVRVIAQHWPGGPTRERMDGIEVIRPRYWWPESWEILRREGGGLPIAWKESWLARLQMIPFLLVHTLAVARYTRGYDVIHAQWTLSGGVAWLSRFIHHCPIVVTLHGSDVFQVASGWLGSPLTCRVLRGCDRIIAVSQALADVAARVGISPASITIIPDGVDLTRFVPMPGAREPLILYVGSLIKRKGIIYLLEAMSQISHRYPSLHLTIVGDGVERPLLEKTSSELGLQGRVTFTGSQTTEQVRQWMQRARLFVLPSVEEGLGVVLLESLACGTPIVATQVGGIPEVVTPGVGMLVPPASPDALAEAIGSLIDDNEKWTVMSHDARKRVEQHFGWDQVAAQLIEIYEQIRDG